MADELDLVDGIARYLAARDLGTYDPTGADGDTFAEHMPATPDAAVVLTLYGGPEPDSRVPVDEPSLQVRVRGGPDPRVSRRRSYAIYSALHGLTRTALPDGTWLVLCVAQAPPASMGVDANGRHEHVVNYRLTVGAPTVNRP
ncbi:minor capsid protein [Embleya sp. NBC_00888]|uniref:minor capsid protein n=1 Tax=Embleya sp. NBC_00888 TaxID=2975960 RepID=UPI00386B1940|nr:minor capsid protein [Embleya sp. NBC_00888]